MTAINFIQTLKHLCGAGETGTLFLVTQDNRQARIGIARGRIIHLGMFPLRGVSAVGALAATRISAVRFQEQVVPDVQTDLPDTQVIINILSAGGGEVSSHPGHAPAEGAAVPVALSREVLRMVESRLTEYLGPIAGILVDEQSAKCANLEALIKALLPNFEDPGQAAAFTKQVRQQLK